MGNPRSLLIKRFQDMVKLESPINRTVCFLKEGTNWSPRSSSHQWCIRNGCIIGVTEVVTLLILWCSRQEYINLVS